MFENILLRRPRFSSSQILRSAAVAALVLSGCQTAPRQTGSEYSRFVGVSDFSQFARAHATNGDVVLLSPPIKAPIPWNQLIVSWNASAPVDTYLKIEASAISGSHQTKFYTMGIWSVDDKSQVRTSVRGQRDSDGTVNTDTLVLTVPADATQLRVTLAGTKDAKPALKFLGVCFANTEVPRVSRAPNHAAWGKTIPTPEHSQFGYPNQKGWCSPTSLSMALSRWAEVLHRPEMDLTVPTVAAAVFDNGYNATGNWPFNTAFAGSFKGMRSYVTRFDDLAEVEDWIAAGIPVILSARWDWLRPGRPTDSAGHLITCIGFTEEGDPVINDPAAHLERGDQVRQIYKREDVLHAWTKSANTVYLVYPESAKIPPNKYGHWADH
jgi:hypothetical protein